MVVIRVEKCKVCEHSKADCVCEFPTRVWGYGRKQMEQDIAQIDFQDAGLPGLQLAGYITGFELIKHQAKYEMLRARCRFKVVLAAQNFASKAKSAAAPVRPIMAATDSYGRRLCTSELQRRGVG
jgi:hypothetical protein